MTVSPQISGLTTQDSQLTLQRLSDAVWLREGAARTATPTTESVAPTEANISRPADRTDFDELDKVIKGLGPLVKRLRATAARYEFQTDEVRDSAIERALRPFRAGHNASGKFPGGITADLDDSLITDVALKGQGIRAGESLELEFELTGRTEAASVSLDLGALFSGSGLTQGFSITVFGEGGGSESLSFVSGQTISQVLTALGSLGSIGIEAESLQSAAGFQLRSSGTGAGSFVSVAIAPADEALGVGVRIDGEAGVRDENGLFTDTGADATATINGEEAERIGDYWVASLGNLDVAIDVDEDAIAAAGDGPVHLGTIGKSDRGRGHHGHEDHHEVRGEHGHRGRHRGHGVREDDDRETRTDSAEHGGGLRPDPADDGTVTKVADPTLRLDTEA